MRHTKTLCTLVLGAVVVSGCADDATSPTSLAPTESLASLSAGTTSSDNQLVVFKKSRIPNGFAAQVAALGGNVELTISTAGAAVISGVDAAGLDAIRASSDVDMVEPEIMLELPEPFEVGVATAADAAPASPGDPSAAYFFPRQWNMRAIGADVAWAAGNTGSSDVTVAILDTGIGYTHEDLVGRVDLSRSVSFVPDDDLYVAYYFPGAHPIADIGYHGTHVAATVASNGIVAAGVTSQTTLMGVKVCSVVTGGCSGSAIFAGIEYAVDNGADVINMSLGGAFQKKDYPGYVSVLNRLFNYAHQNKVTVVVSAGNESADLDHNYYPDDDDVQTHYPSLYKTYCSTPNNIPRLGHRPHGRRVQHWTVDERGRTRSVHQLRPLRRDCGGARWKHRRGRDGRLLDVQPRHPGLSGERLRRHPLRHQHGGAARHRPGSAHGGAVRQEPGEGPGRDPAVGG